MQRLLHIVKEGIAHAKNSIILPLVASITLAGCSDCYTHNDSTIKLNRPVDGHVAYMQILEQESEGNKPSEEFIDLINETHALSSGHMPHDAYATAVSASCLDGHPEWTTNTSFLGMIDRGMYFPSLRFTMINLSTVNHGLGHLQRGGEESEAIARLNEAEQMVVGYKLFMGNPDYPLERNAHHPLEMVRWAAYASAFGLDAMIRHAINEIEAGKELDKYRAADILLYSLLQEQGGNYSTVRDIVERLVEHDTLGREAGRRIAELKDWYATVHEQGGDAAAEASLRAKEVSRIELRRLFGEETAQAYQIANSRLLNNGLVYEQFNEEGGETTIYEGFRDGRICEITGERIVESSRPCRSTSLICTLVGGENVEHLHTALCCTTPPTDGEFTFRRTTEDADVFRYSRASGPVTLEGLSWRNALLLEIKSQTELDPGEYCPDPMP